MLSSAVVTLFFWKSDICYINVRAVLPPYVFMHGFLVWESKDSYVFLQNTDVCTDFCKNTKFLSVKSIKSDILAKRTIFLTSTNLVINFDYIEWANYIQFRAPYCQKHASHEKKLEIKVVRDWISFKKVRKCICLLTPPPFWVELWNLKDLQLFYSITNNFYFKLFFIWCLCNPLLFIYFFIHPRNTNLKCLKSGKNTTGVSQLWHEIYIELFRSSIYD